MAKGKGIQGIKKVQQQIKRLEKKGKPQSGRKMKAAVVGYTANYAVFVHENMDARHNEGREAKFLENPARNKANQLSRVIREAVGAGVPLEKALLMGGLRLQRESQKLVPVDTGNLKNSAFTKLEPL